MNPLATTDKASSQNLLTEQKYLF